MRNTPITKAILNALNDAAPGPKDGKATIGHYLAEEAANNLEKAGDQEAADELRRDRNFYIKAAVDQKKVSVLDEATDEDGDVFYVKTM